jgi:hypothetical protein
MTTRGMMIATAVVALTLGLIVNVPYLILLLLMMAIFMTPQTIVFAICAYLTTRPIRVRPDSHESSDGIVFLTDETER